MAERAVARTYTLLGIEHILLGIDHLLFVLALLMLVANVRTLVWTMALRRIKLPGWAWRLPVYAIGSLAAFWTIQRVAGFG